MHSWRRLSQQHTHYCVDLKLPLGLGFAYISSINCYLETEMFRALAKSVTSFAKGPRAILSSLIAKYLSEYFILDEEQKTIESTLLSSNDKDAQITLQNVKLREKIFLSEVNKDIVITINGSVEEVMFSWRWSFGGGGASASRAETNSSVIQNATLSTRGLQVHIYFDSI